MLPSHLDYERRMLISLAVARGIKRYIVIEPGSLAQLRSCPSNELRNVMESRSLIPDLRGFRDSHGMVFTAIYTGLCLNADVDDTCLFDILTRIADIYVGGDKMLSLSTAAHIGRAAAVALRKPGQTGGRILRIQSLVASQKRLLQIIGTFGGIGGWRHKPWDREKLIRSLSRCSLFGMPLQPRRAICSTQESMSRFVLMCNLEPNAQE